MAQRIDITNIAVADLDQTERDYGKGHIETRGRRSFWIVDNGDNKDD